MKVLQNAAISRRRRIAMAVLMALMVAAVSVCVAVVSHKGDDDERAAADKAKMEQFRQEIESAEIDTTRADNVKHRKDKKSKRTRKDTENKSRPISTF